MVGGDHPLFLAFRPGAVYFALGEDVVPALRQAFAGKIKGTSGIRVEAALGRLATPTVAGESSPVPKIAKEVFGKEKDSDRVQVSVEGGNSLRLRLEAQGAVLKFLSLMPEKGQ
jgi:hypothetical protein